MFSMNLLRTIILVVSLPILFCDGLGSSKKIRRYKICSGNKCKSVRSSTPPSILFNMDNFLYSRWTRWAPCSRQCTTKRYRACRFPLICGDTVVHEEAFCYPRGSQCELIFQNSRRDFLSDDDTSDLDYLDPTEDGLLSQEALLELIRVPTRPERSNTYESSLVAPNRSGRRRRPGKGSVIRHNITRASRHNNDLNYNQHSYFSQRLTTTTVPPPAPPVSYNILVSDEDRSLDFGGRSSAVSVGQDDQLTCGVPRITDYNRNGIALRILGGREAKKGRWPWQVAVLNRAEEAFCGGTLIAPRWILTAAHCVRRRISITIGEHHLHRNDGTERHYKVKSAFIHPDFDPDTVDNDIALLLLPEAVPTEAGLACLPQQSQFLPPPETLCTILGWGKERHNNVFGTTVLHEGKVPLVSNSECRYTYGPYEITPNMFCAGYRTGTVDSCAGDSGGPILCSVDNRWTIFGVTSFGDGCGQQRKYGIYAKVPNYVSWIQKVMQANELN